MDTSRPNDAGRIDDVLKKIERTRQARRHKFYLRDEKITLSHGSGFSVLLNRVGSTAGNPYGYSDSGLSVTLSDSAANDIHTYRSVVSLAAGAPLTGTWQPDARITDPGSVVNTDSRSAFLSSFNGSNPNGTTQ